MFAEALRMVVRKAVATVHGHMRHGETGAYYVAQHTRQYTGAVPSGDSPQQRKYKEATTSAAKGNIHAVIDLLASATSLGMSREDVLADLFGAGMNREVAYRIVSRLPSKGGEAKATTANIERAAGTEEKEESGTGADRWPPEGVTVDRKTNQWGSHYWVLRGRVLDRADWVNRLASWGAKPTQYGAKGYYLSRSPGDLWRKEHAQKGKPGQPDTGVGAGGKPGPGGPEARTGAQSGRPAGAPGGIRALDPRTDTAGTVPAADLSRMARGEVSPETEKLIMKGLEFGMLKEALDLQVEDIGKIVLGFKGKKKAFVLANGTGTGKTYILGGAMRELLERQQKAGGAKKILYVTRNVNLIGQAQTDLKNYGILDGTEFITYSALLKGGFDKSDYLCIVFDECHSAKNVRNVTGKQAQAVMAKAEYTIFSSATPYENPAEMKYLAATGIFDRYGGEDPFRPGVQMNGYDRWAIHYGVGRKGEEGKEGSLAKTYEYRGNIADCLASREWFSNRGLLSDRKIKFPPGLVSAQFEANPLSTENKAEFNRLKGILVKLINDAPESELYHIKGYAVNLARRALETYKIPLAIKRADEALKEGKSVILFSEYRSEREVGMESREQLLQRYAEEDAQKRSGVQGEYTPMWMRRAELALTAFNIRLKSPTQEFLKHYGDQAVEYSGNVSSGRRDKNKKAFNKGEKRVIVGTIAAGGTGLSLHDKIGKFPREQICVSLPWKGTNVDQTSGRAAREGTKSPVKIRWLFADVPEEERISARVAGRIEEMGATVTGIKVNKTTEELERLNWNVKDDETDFFSKMSLVKMIQEDALRKTIRDLAVKGRPTEAQKEAGNYSKHHLALNGLDISVENPAGSYREGVGKDGKSWRNRLAHHYGYIRGTKGKDKDHVDCFLGPDADDASLPVFIVDQEKKDGTFDEHKVLLGFRDKEAAKDGYLANYEDGWKCGPITMLGLDEFKAWVKDPAKTAKPSSEAWPSRILKAMVRAHVRRTAEGVENVRAHYRKDNPFAAKAKAARERYERLVEPTARDAAMAESFPLGVGYGGRSGERRVEATIDRAVAAGEAEKEARWYEAKAEAFERGEINAQGRRPAKDAGKAREKIEAKRERIEAAKEAQRGKESWEVTFKVYADSIGVFGGRSLELIRYDHKEAVAQAFASGKPVPPEVLSDYPDIRPAPEANIIRGCLKEVSALQAKARGPKWKGAYNSIEDFVLSNGRAYTPTPLPVDAPRGEMSRCFMNAAKLMDYEPGLSYVEGYAIRKGLPIPLLHAWCVDEFGKVLDSTWPDDGEEYFGVALSTDYVRRTMLARGKYGIIDNMEERFPIITGEHGASQWSPGLAKSIVRAHTRKTPTGVEHVKQHYRRGEPAAPAEVREEPAAEKWQDFYDVEAVGEKWYIHPKGMKAEHKGGGRPFESREVAEAHVEKNWQFYREEGKREKLKADDEERRDAEEGRKEGAGAPGKYLLKHEIVGAEDYNRNIFPEEVVSRVIWGKVPNEMETNSTDAVSLPGDPSVRALHVTSDSDYWIGRLAKDYGRPKRGAKVIHIRTAAEDIFAEDPQYMTDPDTGEKSDSAVLLTTRKTLRRGVDFILDGEEWDDEKITKALVRAHTRRTKDGIEHVKAHYRKGPPRTRTEADDRVAADRAYQGAMERSKGGMWRSAESAADYGKIAGVSPIVVARDLRNAGYSDKDIEVFMKKPYGALDTTIALEQIGPRPAVAPAPAVKPLHEMTLEEIPTIGDTEKELIGTYFTPTHEQIASSRTTQAKFTRYPVGSWRRDTLNGLYGHEVDQLREFDPEDLVPGEDTPPDRMEDVARYTEWRKEGGEPPPISVVETDKGEFKIMDGHRRWLAAKATGAKITAWVSPTVLHPTKVKSDGKPMEVGLTWELAKRFSEEGRAYTGLKESRAEAAA